VVIGNQRVILQIVLNLEFNAEQALTGWPSGALRLRTRQHDDLVELIVEDNGPGLDAHALVWTPDVFSTSGQLRIGLQVAHWLAEQQGGRLHLTKPEQGTGCRATLSLPIAH
jgi:C4-dicarboxylate-specific signal transduction histidine kinase